MQWTGHTAKTGLTVAEEEETRFGGAFEPVTAEAWRGKVGADLKGKTPEALARDLTSEVWIEALYTEASSPLPEGVRPTRGWAVWQVVSDPRMHRAAELVRAELAGGAEGIWLRAGLDHGIRTLTAGDLGVVLEHFPLGEVPLQLEARIDSLPAAAALLTLAEHRSVDPSSLQGGFGADPLGILVRTGSLPGGLRTAREEMAAVARLARDHAPKMKAALVDTRRYQAAGASVSAEVAWAAATGLAYLRLLDGAGFSLKEACRTLRFTVGVSSHVYSEIAKLRALRWVWAKVVAALGGDAEDQRMSLHAESNRASRSKRDPWVNMLRGTAETFAAAIGGADTIGVVPFDHAVGESDGLARRVARNTQHVLRAESYLDKVDDPAAGSFAFEQLTDGIAREAWAELQDIEGEGGMAKALLDGRVARSIASFQQRILSAVATRKQAVVGVSVFPNLEEERLEREVTRMREVEVELGNELEEVGSDDRHESLLALAEAVRSFRAGGDPIDDAVRKCIGLGVDLYSVGTLLRTGRASLHIAPIERLAPAAPWEALRDKVDAWAARHDERPTAFVANVGPLAEHSARLTWTTNLLAAAGLAAATSDEGYADSAAALEAYDGQPVVVVCTSDERLVAVAEELAPKVKAKGAKMVLVAGRAKEAAEELEKKGVDAFVYAGKDLLHELAAVLEGIGIVQGGPALRVIEGDG